MAETPTHPLIGMRFSHLAGGSGKVVGVFWDEQLGTMLICFIEYARGYQYRVYPLGHLTGDNVNWDKPIARLMPKEGEIVHG